MSDIHKEETLASFNGTKVRIRVLKGEFCKNFLGADFGVEVYAFKPFDETHINEVNSDELTCDTLEEAEAVYERFKKREQQDFLDFANGQTRDWLV